MDVAMNSLLDGAFTEAEIKDVVMNWDGYKSSLPGRFTMAFFKNFKEEIMVDLVKFFNDFYHTRKLVMRLNSAFIALISKGDHQHYIYL